MNKRSFFQLIVIVFCCFFFTKCRENDEIKLDYSKAINIKVPQNTTGQEIYNASSLFDSISATAIRIDSNNLISKIDKVFFIGDTVIVIDQHVAKKILVFSRKGDLLFEFKDVNKSDFVDLSDVVYNEELGLLEIFNATRNKIVSFNIKNGEFIKERRCKLSFFSFFYLGGGAYAYYTHFNDRSSKGIKHNLIIEDSNGNYRKFLPYYEGEITPQDIALSFKTFFRRSNKNYFAPYSSKYIYEITPDSLIPIASLDFGEPNFDIYGGLVKQQDIRKRKSQNYFAGDAFFLNNKNLYFTYNREGTICGFLYAANKKLPNILQIDNDFNELPIYTNFISQTDSFIVQSIDVEEINAIAEKNKREYKEFYSRMKSIVAQYPPGSFILLKLYFHL